MALKAKYQYNREAIMRDVRPLSQRIAETLRQPSISMIIFMACCMSIILDPTIALFSDLIFFIAVLYFWWLKATPIKLPFKLPRTAGINDPNNVKPGGGTLKSDGIMYFGNDKETGEEIWFTNNDARTHILYLGTTGSGKTEGLKSISANALCWASGFLYIDGKADTDLWSTISAMARRFGRDDDLLIMNYMTGNVGGRVPSNTMNPFSSGSAGYLTNMLVSLMPDAEGDNAMWKERAVALVSALMPCLVWKRDNQNLPISVGVIRKYMGLGDIIRLSRDKAVPVKLTAGLVGYLNELPGYVDDAFDDEGNEKPLPPDAPPFDSSVPRQQHGYLSMQFTRSLQSLGDDYGFIFDTQAADIDMMDVVLQRRIMITLIPALEKSSDETANLGKIIASTLKGMMGATLGSTVEGASETAIENKPARSETPFIAIFDEVGYYAAQGMAVMAAQARSLGFCLVYAAQDLPAMEKRVKEEARSITANCNIKLFGKLEDPTQTKEFFEKTVGSSYVTEVSGYSRGASATNYQDGGQASVQVRARADYDELRSFTEGRAVCAFGPNVTEIQVYYSNPGFAKAMRVQRFLPVPPPSEDVLKSLQDVKSVLSRLRSKNWNPQDIPATNDDSADIAALIDGYRLVEGGDATPVSQSALALANMGEKQGYISIDDMDSDGDADQSQDVNMSAAPDPSAPVVSVGDGPLSWLDVIGGESKDAPATENKAGSDNDWDQLMADMPTKAPTSAPGDPVESSSDNDDDDFFDKIFGSDDDELPVPVTTPENKDKEPVPSTTANAADDLQPMSWANIMGMPSESPAAEAEPPTTQTPVAAPDNVEKQSEPAPMSSTDLLTAPPEHAEQSAAPQTASQAPPQTPQEHVAPPSSPASPEVENSEKKSQLTWSDVIGGDDGKTPQDQ